jgi:hypothetical protein
MNISNRFLESKSHVLQFNLMAYGQSFINYIFQEGVDSHSKEKWQVRPRFLLQKPSIDVLNLETPRAK